MPTEARENKIHEDDVAREYGFKGGLVPGVTVYGWLTHPVVEALGSEWLENGSFRTRFARPIYFEEPAITMFRERTSLSYQVVAGGRVAMNSGVWRVRVVNRFT